MQFSYFFFLFLHFSSIVFSQPNPRHLEDVVYDKTRDRLILFGGTEIIPGGWEEPSMLYEWDGIVWKKFETPGPVGRRGHGWVYDEHTKKTLLIGGVAKGKSVEDSILFDVWSWDGRKWKLLNVVCPVKEPKTVYDPVKKRILVYGEVSNKSIIKYDGDRAFELWEYKSNIWRKLSSDGPSDSKLISFDSHRKKTVIPIFTEMELAVWEWNGKEWKKTVCQNECPAYRTRYAFYYHPVEKQTFLFGGLSQKREQLGDFWKWDGTTWKSIETKAGPSVRNSAHFVYGNNQLMLYGGSVPKAAPLKGIELCNEIWSWKDNFWKILK